MSADLQQQPEAPEAPQPEPVVDTPSAEVTDPAQSETTADAKPPDAEDGDKKTRRNLSAIQKRIDELTRDKHDARRELEAERQARSQLEAEFRKQQGASSEPKLEQFQDYNDFISAKAKWISERTVSEKLEEFRQTNLQSYEERSRQENARAQEQHFNRALTAVESEGKKAYADFEEVVGNGPRLGPLVGQLVLQTDRPHDISYYLAKNPEHAMAIASLPPVLAMREISKLEAQFVNKRVTSASPPPRTVGGSEKVSKGLSDDLPAAEWYRRRQLEINRKT